MLFDIADEFALGLTFPESTSKSMILESVRRMALKKIEAFILAFTDPQALSAAASSSSPAALMQVTESARIPEAGQLRCSGAEVGRFMVMLRSPLSVLKTCSEFALLQGTGAPRVLRAAAASATATIDAKIFAKIVLRNIEYHQTETSK